MEGSARVTDINIRLDNITGDEITSLLQEHHSDMRLHSPEESVHALDVGALQAPNIRVWSAWIEGELAGCGALKILDNKHGEIKSMRTASQHLRKGVAAQLLTKILSEAKVCCCIKVSLETGSMDVFIPARKMYENFGFNYCVPFADYTEDPYSVFMEKYL